MPTAAEAIVHCIKTGSMPSSDLLSSLYDSQSNRFHEQESTHLDYKAQFPFSLSDDYFGGILRLICALYNTYGGIIIFGVHDDTRDPGHNKVKINIERLNNVIRTTLSSPIEIRHGEYYLAGAKDANRKVDVLLVPKRPMAIPPVRFQKAVGNQKPDVIWMRVGHEVVEPASVDLPMLYSSRDDYGVGAQDGPIHVESALPPSPATLKEFIGRRNSLDRLYTWLFSSDEPRTFLFGKGGSGKSTIAYEFSRMISESAGGIPTRLGRPVDYVLFLSAKLTALDPLSRRIVKNQAYDFSNSLEFFQAILTLVGWTEADKIASSSESEAVSELQKLFDTAQLLLVVDDIDTLTTAGRDPGMDTLYRLLVRSHSGGKILYTLRNAPTQSLANAIEVPGLDLGGELTEFVSACSKQFNVPEPDREFVFGDLSHLTERRPLAVEVLIGFRRTCGDYREALQLYRGREGDELRAYLFQREYSALPTDNRARLFLAALALLGRPASFSELQSILQFSPEQLNDCVSQTLEMFLQAAPDSSGETRFSLGAATEQFITRVSTGLSVYDRLKAGIQYFKSPFLPKNPQMSQLQFDVGRLLNQQDFARAAEILSMPGYPASITQHPTFNMLKGRAFAKLKPPKYEEARAAFTFAATHGSTDIQGFREWYWMEKDSGFNELRAIEVCDSIIGRKSMASEVKAEFNTKKGQTFRGLAVQAFPVDPEKSISYQAEALSALLESFELYHKAKPEQEQFSRTRDALRDVFRYLFISASRSLSAQRPDLVNSILRFFAQEAKSKRYYFDLAETPAIDCIKILSSPRTSEEYPRNRAFIQKLQGVFDAKVGLKFRDETARSRIILAGRAAVGKLAS
jgi:hypothetical protein